MKELTDEQLNQSIAEACGWRDIRNYTRHKLEWIDPQTPERVVLGKPPKPGSCTVPDYCNDLNAMHEAEETLTQDQEGLFYTTLIRIEGVRSGWQTGEYKSISHATARQRAEAFYRTLNPES